METKLDEFCERMGITVKVGPASIDGRESAEGSWP